MLGYKSKAKDSAKLVVLTGRNPQRYLEWEAQALHAIKSRCGKIGVEHWQGRQPYAVGERQEDSYAHQVQEQPGDGKRAPSPISTSWNHREHVAYRTLMEQVFTTDKSVTTKMGDEDQWRFFMSIETQEAYYQEREDIVKGVLMETTGGDVRTALMNADKPLIKSAYEHGIIVKQSCGTLPTKDRDDLVDRLRDGRIHDCSYQGMRDGEDPYAFLSKIKNLRAEIIRYTMENDLAHIEDDITDAKVVECMLKSITRDYRQVKKDFAKLAEAEQTVTKLGEMLQEEYHDLKSYDEREKANGGATGAPVMAVTSGESTCWHCGEKGHKKAECPKWKGKGRKNPGKGRGTQRAKSDVPCRFGAKCFRENCPFKHPEGHDAAKVKRDFNEQKRKREGDGDQKDQAQKLAKLFAITKQQAEGEIELDHKIKKDLANIVDQYPNIFLTIAITVAAAAQESFFAQKKRFGYTKYAVWDGGAGICVHHSKSGFIPGTLQVSKEAVEGKFIELGEVKHAVKGIGVMALAVKNETSGSASDDITVLTSSASTGWWVPTIPNGMIVASENVFEDLGVHALRPNVSDPKTIMSENKESGGHTVKVERNYGIQTVELLPTSASALRFQSLHSAVKGGMHVAHTKGALPAAVIAIVAEDQAKVTNQKEKASVSEAKPGSNGAPPNKSEGGGATAAQLTDCSHVEAAAASGSKEYDPTDQQAYESDELPKPGSGEANTRDECDGYSSDESMPELYSPSDSESDSEEDSNNEEHAEEAYKAETSKEWQDQVRREAQASGEDGAADFPTRRSRVL